MSFGEVSVKLRGIDWLKLVAFHPSPCVHHLQNASHLRQVAPKMLGSVETTALQQLLPLTSQSSH